MNAENLIVVLGVRALSVVGSLCRLMATPTQFFETLRLFLLESRSLFQKGREFSCWCNALFQTGEQSINANLQLLVKATYTKIQPRRPTSDCKTLFTTGEESCVGKATCGASVICVLVGTSLPPLYPDPFRVDWGAKFSEEERSSESLCSMADYVNEGVVWRMPKLTISINGVRSRKIIPLDRNTSEQVSINLLTIEGG